MSAERVDSHPVRTAATAQAGVALGSVVGAGGLPGLYMALAPQPFGRVDVLIVVALAAAPSAAGLLIALVRTVRRAQPETTPWRDAQDDLGRPLTPPDTDLIRLLRQTLRMNGAAERPARQGPAGTRVGAAINQARSMTVDDAAAYRAAAGPESKQPHERWEPTSDDWYGEPAAAQDERIAREHGPRAARMSRATGPDPAQRPRRRHEYRGGPTDGGGR